MMFGRKVFWGCVCTAALVTTLTYVFMAYSGRGKIVYILSFDRSKVPASFVEDPWWSGLVAHGYKVTGATNGVGFDNADYMIFFNDYSGFDREYIRRHPEKNAVLFLWEPPAVASFFYNPAYHRYFSKVYTWDDTLVDGKKYFKFYYPQPSLIMREPLIDFDARRFCAQASHGGKGSSHPNELYSARKKTALFFEQNHPDEFDQYGDSWPKEIFPKTFKGRVNDKTECLKHYKFCICYENNQNIMGYITEKIFDCFRAGCVPVYWGASNVTDYIPKECFIDRRNFNSDQALYAFLTSITREQFNRYIDAIRSFLASDKAYPFSNEAFAQTMVEAVS